MGTQTKNEAHITRKSKGVPGSDFAHSTSSSVHLLVVRFERRDRAPLSFDVSAAFVTVTTFPDTPVPPHLWGPHSPAPSHFPGPLSSVSLPWPSMGSDCLPPLYSLPSAPTPVLPCQCSPLSAPSPVLPPQAISTTCRRHSHLQSGGL